MRARLEDVQWGDEPCRSQPSPPHQSIEVQVGINKWKGQSYAPLEDWKNSIFPIEKCYFQYKYNYGK